MKIYLIRHGQTEGNSEKRYIGRTDEPLSNVGMAQVNHLVLPKVDKVICSPMLRCRQTAELIFGKVPFEVVLDLRETDFGMFEGKNAQELVNSLEYRKWVDSGCQGKIPQGETVSEFKKRCCDAFEKVVRENPENTLAFVVHGGTIMSILEKFEANRDFYAYHIANGQWIGCECKIRQDISLRILSGALHEDG